MEKRKRCEDDEGRVEIHTERGWDGQDVYHNKESDYEKRTTGYANALVVLFTEQRKRKRI